MQEENSPKKIVLQDGERIVAVVPEYCSGPGWSNAPAWVYIESNTGNIRCECLQPGDQPHDLLIFFSVAAQMSQSLIEAINSVVQVQSQRDALPNDDSARP